MTKKQILEYVDENFTKDNDTGLICRVACYIRVSTTEQKLHGLSLDAQRDTLTRYAEEHGLKIVGWYEDEGVSGRKLIRRRPALQRMLNDAKEGVFDRIIFIKLDRYFRSVAEYHESQKILEKHNVLWTATEEVYDLTTANGRYWVQQKLAMAEYEADNTGERIMLVNDYKIRAGQAITGPQSQGLAFTVQKDEEGVKRVVPDPETKELCMDYINHLLTYHNKRQATLFINEKYNKNIHYNSFKNMIKDTKLYGHYKGNDNYCEPYIDKATFDELQLIAKNKNIKSRRNKRVYLFSGLIKCPHCGNKLTGTCSVARSRTGSNGKVYKYTNDIKAYRCNKYVLARICTFPRTLNEHTLEKQLISNFDSYIEAFIEETESEDKRKRSDNAAKRVSDLNEELRKINRMYRAGNMTDKEYDTDTADIKERLARAEAQMKPLIKRDLSPYRELIGSDWRDLYQALNEENRRAFWRKYIKEIVVDSNGKIEGVIFF